ncbi:MAG: hypothetical protein ACSHXF_07765 [Aquaticitalea sp.]
MKYIFSIFLLFIMQCTYAQQYDSVQMERDSIDLNNQVYKIGNVYIFDYEIIENGKASKLKTNSRKGFELVEKNADSIGVSKIYLLIKPSENSERTNENQTQISYLEGPDFASYSSTGAVDNIENVWIHPIRSGFFSSLETCPFPYIKKPLQIGLKWKDSMIIGEGWGNDMWGKWSGDLLLEYSYEITKKEKIISDLGEIECYVVESMADSKLGSTKLKSYYSEHYGFIRFEYVLLTGIKINMWLIEFMENKEFNDTRSFFKTKEYIKQ